MVDSKVLFCHGGWLLTWTSDGKGRKSGELLGRWVETGWGKGEALPLVPVLLDYSCWPR